MILSADPRRAPADARRSVRAFSARERAARADRGLMSLPELLMLDKPSLGLAPIIVGELFESSRATNARGIARKRRDSESVSGPLASGSCDRYGCALARRCSARARAVASAAASRASSVVVVTRTPGAAALRYRAPPSIVYPADCAAPTAAASSRTGTHTVNHEPRSPWRPTLVSASINPARRVAYARVAARNRFAVSGSRNTAAAAS